MSYAIYIRGLDDYIAEDAASEVGINTGSGSDTATLLSDPTVDTTRWHLVGVMGLNPEYESEADAFTTLGRRAVKRTTMREKFIAQTERISFVSEFPLYRAVNDACARNYTAVVVQTYDHTIHTAGKAMLCRASCDVSHEYSDGTKRLTMTFEKVAPYA